MKQLLDTLVLVLALFAGDMSVHAQNDRVPEPRRPATVESGRFESDSRSSRAESNQAPDQRGASGSNERQGRLTPEERQTLRRQIDEAGHDLYKRKH